MDFQPKTPLNEDNVGELCQIGAHEELEEICVLDSDGSLQNTCLLIELSDEHSQEISEAEELREAAFVKQLDKKRSEIPELEKRELLPITCQTEILAKEPQKSCSVKSSDKEPQEISDSPRGEEQEETKAVVTTAIEPQETSKSLETKELQETCSVKSSDKEPQETSDYLRGEEQEETKAVVTTAMEPQETSKSLETNELLKTCSVKSSVKEPQETSDSVRGKEQEKTKTVVTTAIEPQETSKSLETNELLKTCSVKSLDKEPRETSDYLRGEEQEETKAVVTTAIEPQETSKSLETKELQETCSVKSSDKEPQETSDYLRGEEQEETKAVVTTAMEPQETSKSLETNELLKTCSVKSSVKEPQETSDSLRGKEQEKTKTVVTTAIEPQETSKSLETNELLKTCSVKSSVKEPQETSDSLRGEEQGKTKTVVTTAIEPQGTLKSLETNEPLKTCSVKSSVKEPQETSDSLRGEEQGKTKTVVTTAMEPQGTLKYLETNEPQTTLTTISTKQPHKACVVEPIDKKQPKIYGTKSPDKNQPKTRPLILKNTEHQKSCNMKSLDKLKMQPVVNLAKIDIEKLKLKVKTKLSVSRRRSVKRLGSRSVTASRKNTAKGKSNVVKAKAPPRKSTQKSVKVKSSASSQLSLQKFDAKDFVSGICRVCGEKSTKCTNIFDRTKKLDHIIHRFLPISVDKDDKQPKMVCKNCLSVLLAVENLSVKCSMKQGKQKDTEPPEEDPEIKEEIISAEAHGVSTEVQNAKKHHLQPMDDEVSVMKNDKTQNIHQLPHSKLLMPRISLIPVTQLISPSKLSKAPESLLIPAKSANKSSVLSKGTKPISANTSVANASGIEILSTFSLSGSQSKILSSKSDKVTAALKPPISKTSTVSKTSVSKAKDSKADTKRSRPVRKVAPPVKFQNFIGPETVFKPKDKPIPILPKPHQASASYCGKNAKGITSKVVESSKTPKGSAEEMLHDGSSFTLDVEIGDLILTKSINKEKKINYESGDDLSDIQYSFDYLRGKFKEESSKNGKPKQKKKSNIESPKKRLPSAAVSETTEGAQSAPLSSNTNETPTETNEKAASILKEQRKTYEKNVLKLRKHIAAKKEAETKLSLDEMYARIKKRSLADRGKKGISTDESRTEKEEVSLVNAHNPASLVDISHVLVTNTASTEIQNLLKLTKKCLSVKVLIPSGKDEKSSSNLLQSDTAISKKKSSDVTQLAKDTSKQNSVDITQPPKDDDTKSSSEVKKPAKNLDGKITTNVTESAEDSGEKSTANVTESMEDSNKRSVSEVAQAAEYISRKSTLDVSQSAKNLKEKSPLNATQPAEQILKQVIETPVEIFSNKIKDTLLPVYFRVLTKSFPSEKVKQTILSTITKMLSKQKKEILSKWEAEGGKCVPSLFKRMSEVLNPNEEMKQCVKCNKKFQPSEIVSHIKFHHLHQCLQCKVVRHSSEALDHHNRMIHNTGTKKCEVCKKLFTRYLSVSPECEHWFRCSMCGHGFLDHNAYIKHEQKHFNSDFLDFIYKMMPGLEDSVHFKLVKSELFERQDDGMLIDYFWDKENFPVISFLTTKDKIFCSKCFKVFECSTTFKNHTCAGDNKHLQIQFRALMCHRCHRTFKSRLTFCKHYRDCVDHNFNVTTALESNFQQIEIECSLCSLRFHCFDKFNSHFDLCYKNNIFQCGFCQKKISTYFKENHLKQCGGSSANDQVSTRSQTNEQPNVASDILNLAEIDDLVDSAETTVEDQPPESERVNVKGKLVCNKAVNTPNAGGQNDLPKDSLKTIKTVDTASEEVTVASSARTSEKGMDAFLDESLVDFTQSTSSTPLSKKFKITTVEDKIVEKLDPNSPKIDEMGGASENSDKNLAPVISDGARRVAPVATFNKVHETKDPSGLSESTEKTTPNTPHPAFIKKCFSVKILTTSVTDGAPDSGSGDKSKSTENLDPNSKDALYNFLKDSEKSAGTEDNSSVAKILSVSYSVFFTEINGKLLPHHFRLAASNLGQETRDKASSVIKSLLRKERTKILEESPQQQIKSLKSTPKLKEFNRSRFKPHVQKPLVSNTQGSTAAKVMERIVKNYSERTPNEYPLLKQSSNFGATTTIVCMHCKETVDKINLREHTLKMHMVQCHECKVYLTSSDELLNHVCLVHKEPFTTCLKCCKKFRQGEDVSNCPCEFKCRVCTLPFTNWLEYLDHEMVHFNQMAFHHASVTLKNASVVEKLQGVSRANPNNPLIYPCEVCGKRYADVSEVTKCAHSYKCIKCKSIFNNYPLFITHGCSLKVRVNRRQYKDKNKVTGLAKTKIAHMCPLCDGIFDSMSLFTNHYTMCAEDSELPLKDSDGNAVYQVKCPYCLTVFDSVPTFHRHHFDCQKANAFFCNNCQEFISKSNKENHLKDCTPDILCDNCGVSFPNRLRYNFHLRQQRDGTIICKNLITDDEGHPFDTEPDPEVVMEMIRDGRYDLTSCAFCGKMFGTVAKNIRHTLAVHLDKIKTCPVCKMRIQRSTGALLSHRKIHSTAELVVATRGEAYGAFKCTVCYKYFDSTYHKILHSIYHHQRELLNCNNCQKEFITKIALETHQIRCTQPQKKNPEEETENSTKTHVCLICDLPFEKFTDYVTHKKSHAGRHACGLCEKTFLSKGTLREHKKRIHFGTPSTCEFCGMEFRCLKNLQVHQRNQHSDGPPSICETCGKTFKTPKHLRKHMTLHTGEKPYSCSRCNLKFRLKENLQRHESKHSGVTKPFKCACCGASFSQFNNLHLHRRQAHPEIHKFQCEKCNLCYNDERYYKKHIAICSADHKKVTKLGKPHIPRRHRSAPVTHCPHCNEDVSSLRVHLSRRTDERPFHCKTCPKKFSYSCSLKAHEAQHFNSTKFKCKLCDKGFLGLKQYSFHLQMKHNDCFPLHCAHCSKGYNDNKFYYRHIDVCNEFIEPPKYDSNSKKLIPQCTICNKFFLNFNDLRIHSAMIHKNQSYKKYQCQICDSAYDSNALLIKHSKHHYKDRNNPGMFLCPKCKYQHYEFKTVYNHDCPFASKAAKDSDASTVSSPTKRVSSSADIVKPSKRRKSSNIADQLTTPTLSFENDYETEDDDLDSSDDDHDDSTDSDTDAVSKMQKFSKIEEYEEYEEYEVGNVLVSPPKIEKIEPDPIPYEVKIDSLQEDPSNLIEETVTDSSNFIYHCSFCRGNFDTLGTLQNHLRGDHGFDLNNLEFQIL